MGLSGSKLKQTAEPADRVVHRDQELLPDDDDNGFHPRGQLVGEDAASVGDETKTIQAKHEATIRASSTNPVSSNGLNSFEAAFGAGVIGGGYDNCPLADCCFARAGVGAGAGAASLASGDAITDDVSIGTVEELMKNECSPRGRRLEACANAKAANSPLESREANKLISGRAPSELATSGANQLTGEPGARALGRLGGLDRARARLVARSNGAGCCCCLCRRATKFSTGTGRRESSAAAGCRWPYESPGNNSSIALNSCEPGGLINDCQAIRLNCDASPCDVAAPDRIPGKQSKFSHNSSSSNNRFSRKRSLVVEGANCQITGADILSSTSESSRSEKPSTNLEESASSELIVAAARQQPLCCKNELMLQPEERQQSQHHLASTKSSLYASPGAGRNNNSGDKVSASVATNKSKQHYNSKESANTRASSRQRSRVRGELSNSIRDDLPEPACNKSSEEPETDSCKTFISCKKEEEQPAQQERSECDQVKARLKAAASKDNDYTYIDWNLITHRYRKMPPHPDRSRLCWQLETSCFCRLLIFTIQTLFPIFSSFKGYSLPGDLITDLIAGSTVAVLHIPQGMAYGLLAGVDPIYGLYVSFVPVVVMALMSRSRHVSYGTFAILSMLLANACELAKSNLVQYHAEAPAGSHVADDKALVMVNNHRMVAAKEVSNLVGEDRDAAGLAQDWFVSSGLANAISGSSSSAPSDQEPPPPFVMPTNIEILTCICILVGLIQVTMSLMRLGILSLMFSDQLVSSFTAASAFHVISSQVPYLFDLTSPSVPNGLFKVCRSWWALTLRLFEGFNYYTACLSAISIMFLLLVKELVEPLIKRRLCKSLTCLPSELFLMACIILSSWYWKFEQNFGVEVIGHVPTNLPAPKPPRLDLAPILFQDALTVALVSFAMNLSLGQVYAKRNRYQLDPNQELFALGTSNVVGSFFSCFPCASSLSRSAVQSSLNVRSQVCSLFSCGIVVLIICYFAPILHDLPRSTLSCIIVVALKGILFQVKDFYENWRLSKLDAIVWITTFVSVLAFGVTYGLVLGIAASLFMVFVRLLNPNHSILGQLPGTEIYVDRDAFMDCQEVEQVKIFRFNSALCYLNRTMFKACIEKSLPMIYKRKSFLNSFYTNQMDTGGSRFANENENDKIKFLVIDCSALAYCDYSGAETLVDILEELEEFKVHVYLAACPVKLINMIEKMKRTAVLKHNVHPTITDALNHARYLRGRQMQQCSMTNCGPDICTCLHSIINGLP